MIEPIRPDAVAVGFKVQTLQLGASPVSEEKAIAGQWVVVNLTANDSGKAIIRHCISVGATHNNDRSGSRINDCAHEVRRHYPETTQRPSLAPQQLTRLLAQPVARTFAVETRAVFYATDGNCSASPLVHEKLFYTSSAGLKGIQKPAPL